MLQAFASGCTAMTGVEAVSNGVRAFRQPCSDTAKRTLTIIIALLMLMLGGIAYLVKAYNIAATDPGATGYQSVLSMLVGSGRGTRNFLLRKDRFGSGGARPFGKYSVCGFSAAMPGHCLTATYRIRSFCAEGGWFTRVEFIF